MSTHKIDVERSGTTNGMDWEAEYVITYNFTPGCPETGPSYASGGEPATGPEVEFVSITPDAGDHGAFTDMAQAGLDDWAKDWLAGDGYDQAIENALDDLQGQEDDAAERRAEQRAEDRREDR